MSKQIKRVPIHFNWPLEKAWWGYELPEVPCLTCGTDGKSIPFLTVDIIEKNELWKINQPQPCPVCCGKGKIRPIIEVPHGPSYQIWNTAFCSAPISPAFGAPDGLAHWLTEHEIYGFGIFRLTYQQWLEFILGQNETLSTVITSRLDEYPDRWDSFTMNFIEELFETSG